MTTVGYGDVTPEEPEGRFIATLVMLEGVAFVAIIVAVITSIFIARQQAENAAVHAALVEDSSSGVHERLEAIESRLGRLESLLERLPEPEARPDDPG